MPSVRVGDHVVTAGTTADRNFPLSAKARRTHRLRIGRCSRDESRHAGAVRAAVVPRHGPAEVIEVRDDWPEPDPPGPDEVLVVVQCAGLNPSDAKIRAGGGRLGGVELPYVSGREAAGRVVEVGQGVDWLKPGQEVFAFFGWGAHPGGHAERLVVAASALALSPLGVPVNEAAGLPQAGLTALQGLEVLGPRWASACW